MKDFIGLTVTVVAILAITDFIGASEHASLAGLIAGCSAYIMLTLKKDKP